MINIMVSFPCHHHEYIPTADKNDPMLRNYPLRDEFFSQLAKQMELNRVRDIGGLTVDLPVRFRPVVSPISREFQVTPIIQPANGLEIVRLTERKECMTCTQKIAKKCNNIDVQMLMATIKATRKICK